MTSLIDVAVGVIFNSSGQILVALRNADKEEGGLWEFPGGKFEPGEQPMEALKRELSEEVGIDVVTADPLIQYDYAYPRKKVRLHVWRVTDYLGEPYGKEDQPVHWATLQQLKQMTIPKANIAILKALSLPACYAISPQPDPDHLEAFVSVFLKCLERHKIKLAQLRAHNLTQAQYSQLADRLMPQTQQLGCRLLLNCPPVLAIELGAPGVHLTARQLYENLNWPDEFLVGASCHNLQDLRRAVEVGADFAVLSPVLKTASCPDKTPLGWRQFSNLIREIRMPAYALGGMTPAHLETAKMHGAQGIAGISAFFQEL